MSITQQMVKCVNKELNENLCEEEKEFWTKDQQASNQSTSEEKQVNEEEPQEISPVEISINYYKDIKWADWQNKE